MKKATWLGLVELYIIFLIVSLPIAFAEENNLVYNKNGALITGDSFYREYNGFGQLIKIHLGNSSTGNITEEFVWHPTEERILQKRVYFNNSTIKEKVTYINQNYIVVKNSSGIFNETYVHQDGTLVAQVDTNGNKQFLHNDHLGSSTLITDINGNVVENNFYEPFGQIIEGGKVSRYDYTGKEFDSQTQDYDFNARRYNPNWGKFIQADKTVPHIYNPQSLNRYTFVYNNPYRYTDPNGLWAIQNGLDFSYTFGSYYPLAGSISFGKAYAYDGEGVWSYGVYLSWGPGISAGTPGASVEREIITTKSAKYVSDLNSNKDLTLSAEAPVFAGVVVGGSTTYPQGTTLNQIVSGATPTSFGISGGLGEKISGSSYTSSTRTLSFSIPVSIINKNSDAGNADGAKGSNTQTTSNTGNQGNKLQQTATGITKTVTNAVSNAISKIVSFFSKSSSSKK